MDGGYEYYDLVLNYTSAFLEISPPKLVRDQNLHLRTYSYLVGLANRYHTESEKILPAILDMEINDIPDIYETEIQNNAILSTLIPYLLQNKQNIIRKATKYPTLIETTKKLLGEMGYSFIPLLSPQELFDILIKPFSKRQLYEIYDKKIKDSPKPQEFERIFNFQINRNGTFSSLSWEDDYEGWNPNEL